MPSGRDLRAPRDNLKPQIWALRRFAILLVAFVFPLVCIAQSSEQPETSVPGTILENNSATSQDAGSDRPPTTSTTSGASDNAAKSASRGTILVAPLPVVSPAIGTGIIPIAGYIFPFSRNDRVSPPSTVGAGGLITNNGTRGFGIGAQLFMGKTAMRSQAAMFVAMRTTTCTASELPQAMRDSSCHWNNPATLSLAKSRGAWDGSSSSALVFFRKLVGYAEAE